MSMSSSESPLRLSRQLCFSLYAASHAIMRAYRPLLEPLGVTYSQYLVLLVLWDRDGRSLTEIGTEIGLDSGTLTPLLKRMEGAGLVTRTRERDDERRIVVALTARGRGLRSEAEGIPSALACSMRLDREEIHALKLGVDRLREGLAASADPDGAPHDGSVGPSSSTRSTK